MKINKTLKIATFLVVSLLTLVLLLGGGINYFINRKLPDIIAENNDTAYDLIYDKIHFSLLKNTLSIKNISLKPKKNANITQGVYNIGSVERIRFSGVNFYDLITNKKLKAYTISFVKPDITVFRSFEKDTLNTTSNNWLSVIDVDKIKIENAYFKILNATGDSLLYELFNFNTEVDGIHASAHTLGKKIPFTYTDYSFQIDSVYGVINNLQFLKSGAVKVTPKHIELENLRVLPALDSKALADMYEDGSTRFCAEVPYLSIHNADWGFDDKDKLFVNITTLEMDSINLKALKGNSIEVPIESSEIKPVKPLIPFRLDVKEIHIRNADFQTSQLAVRQMNLKLKNISNRVGVQLLVEELQLNQPEFIQIPVASAKKKHRKLQLNDLIFINKFVVNNAKYMLKNNKGNLNKLVVEDLNFEMNSIQIDQQTLSDPIPFSYDKLKLHTKKIHFNAGNVYDIHSEGVELDGNHAIVKALKVVPKISRKQHVRQLKFAEDYYDVSVRSLELNSLKWGFNRQGVFYTHLGELVLHQMDAAIYRDVSIPRSSKENNLYSHRLRHLNFPFEVHSLKIKNSKLTYEEDAANNTEPGKLSFTNFNLNASDLYGGYKKIKGPKTQITVQTQFMEKGNLKTSWQFDVMDQKERFNINGSLINFPASAMNPFLTPYLQVATEGTIDEMIFNFSGDNDTAHGTYAMDFRELKVKVFNKEKQERKLLTAAANAVVRSNTSGLKKVEIMTVERNKEASFFNFLWLCIMQGLKQTVI